MAAATLNFNIPARGHYLAGETVTATIGVTGLAPAQPEERTAYAADADVILNDGTQLDPAGVFEVVKPAVAAQSVASRALVVTAPGGKSITMTPTATPGVYTGVAAL